MVDQNPYYSASGSRSAAEIDEGLRAYMLTVYNYMASALALTGLAAYVTANTPAILQLLYTVQGNMIAPTMLGYVAMFSPLAFVLALNFGINRMQASTVQMVFWAFAVVMGLSLSSILLTYTGASVAKTFFVTAAAFGSLSLYGYTTKKNLTGMGSFLIMGLFGLIIASIVNMFMQSGAMDFIISVVGVLIFAGLTAYDTQRIKLMYLESDHSETASKKAVMGALSLYLDFINMFLFLLRFMGNRE
ncbi:Bax inhibitor-1/YccA family protein [Emcibacteraceae bacterium]|jgi:FtsH-binding integral membrane protein|uniref:Bax inhibitor-1/YccA family protein n=1 Tax=Pseudemcibacter sp. TaxID=2943293 RepID=UPI002326A4D9|nr:Bax inhibitor-1/YccA family protein [Kordiimonadaceae bacterium]MDA7569007.1 Bax inhibitor-1/YccA family protein [Emcibacteraceae bacterium]MDA9771226.1 Bax inhibitor-1/YccA family protein [Emcibacteraceae bacterium]MDC1090357.1 Bax inhibitor-1/YccA family protein [Emcibacteraceae bacterium]MDG1022105.1 Bax inhibitor-1/YccA family protein [Emcibacteraceae bacterium]